MKKLKIILLILFIAVVLFSAAAYIDYFIVVKRTTYPKIALKKEISDDLLVYNSVFYKVWYCKLNNMYTIGNYSDKDAICSNTLKYDKEGNYTNAMNVKIANDNMKLISNFYSYETIGNMNSEDVENAIYVSKEAYKVKFKYVLDSSGDKQETHSGHYLVDFPKFEKNKKEDYEWVYKKEYYCMNNNFEIADYQDGECGEFKSIGLEKKWCELYKASNLSEVTIASELCGKL